jgi:nucleoside diphosphate kinase
MSLKNSAFVFVKPHANTEATRAMVKEGLQAAGLTILSECELGGQEIDEKKLIDNHYYAIASKATILKPNQLNVPNAPFEAQFGLSWEAALATGNVFNALDACKELGLTAMEMDQQWAITKKNKKLVKLGGGFYCGLVEVAGKTPLYVFNGFFMEMRSKFTDPSVSIHCYVVEWDAASLAWKDFRGQLLGPTDPAEAPAGSLRGKIAAQWESLGLKAAPNVGDNGVHASASPFEGLAERLNWCGATLEADSFGSALLAAGIPAETIKAWSVDPQVKVDAAGKMGSVFDSLEDSDASECLDKLKALHSFNA